MREEGLASGCPAQHMRLHWLPSLEGEYVQFCFRCLLFLPLLQTGSFNKGALLSPGVLRMKMLDDLLL